MLIDLKLAIRSLRNGVAPLIVSVLSLSLGIAATVTMLSVVDAVDFRPLPFQNPSELVELSEGDPARPDLSARVAPGVYLDWREHTRSISSLAAASPVVVSLQDDGEGLDAVRVTDNFFSTLGVQPAVGRVLAAEEIHQHARVAVISHDLWRTRFGGDPQVLGSTIPLSWAGEYRSVPIEPYTIVGVLPRAVRYPLGSQVWIPAAGGFGDSRRDSFLTVVGRLAPEASVEAARDEFEVLHARLSAETVENGGRNVVLVNPLRDAMRAAVGERGAAARFSLLGIAAFVLLLVVFNVAGLLVARTTAQERELRMRLALGSPRSRLATFLLMQSLALSFIAGTLGVVISFWLIQLVSSRLQVADSGMALILDERFLLAALLLALVAGILAALLPIWRLSRLEHHGVLRGASAGNSGIAGTGGVQGGLVVGQIALAVVLLSGAALLSADFLRLFTNETGFDPERLLVASLPISMAAPPEESIEQARRVKGRIARSEQLSSVALGGLPAAGYRYRLDSGETLSEGRIPISYRVSPEYFATLRVPLEGGREFRSSDQAGSMPVGIVNRMAGEFWWPNESPLGKRVQMVGRAGVAEWVRIVGLVGNERVDRSLTSEVKPVLYRPFNQLTGERRRTRVFARTVIEAEATFSTVQQAIDEEYRGDGWRGQQILTMESMLGSTLAVQKFRAWALSLFSLVAIFLAAMGIYGVVATMVAQRKAEIGVRIALGARPVQILALISGRGVRLAVIGFTLGLAGSFAISRILESLLVGATDFDLRWPLAAGIVLAATVLAACFFPAQQAARIDPSPLLRDV